MMVTTSIFTSNQNSLPYELIIKLIYYLDSSSIKEFSNTCSYIKKYNFYRVLIPYKILDTYEYRDILYSCNIKDWFNKNINLLYFEDNNYSNNNILMLIEDLICIIDNTIIQNISTRIYFTNSNIMYSKRQYIHKNLKNTSIETLLNLEKKEISNVRLHEILRIPAIMYRRLRRSNFNVLALMY